MGRGARRSWGVGGEATREGSGRLHFRLCGVWAWSARHFRGHRKCVSPRRSRGRAQPIPSRRRCQATLESRQPRRVSGPRSGRRSEPPAACELWYRSLPGGREARKAFHSGTFNSCVKRKSWKRTRPRDERACDTRALLWSFPPSAARPPSFRGATWVPLPGPHRRLSLPEDPGPLPCCRPGRPPLPGTDTALTWTPTTRPAFLARSPPARVWIRAPDLFLFTDCSSLAGC